VQSNSGQQFSKLIASIGSEFGLRPELIALVGRKVFKVGIKLSAAKMRLSRASIRFAELLDMD